MSGSAIGVTYRHSPRRIVAASWLLLGACGGDPGAGRDGGPVPVADGSALGAPFAVRVVAFEAGPGAGFGQEGLPDVVLGPPRGGGDYRGSLDVLSLGVGGEIVVELGRDAVDGPGTDLLVFENPFRSGASVFTEPGIVGASDDGEQFMDFPCDPAQAPYAGCAGRAPVHAHTDDNDLDPTDPDMAGGDAFDLADIALDRARFLRIRDAQSDRDLGGGSGGFDLDAVSVVGSGLPR